MTFVLFVVSKQAVVFLLTVEAKDEHNYSKLWKNQGRFPVRLDAGGGGTKKGMSAILSVP